MTGGATAAPEVQALLRGARDRSRRRRTRRCQGRDGRAACPSGLVFADGGRPYDWEAILALTEPGGLIVKDDLTPGRPVEGDAVREFLFGDPRLAAAEILATPAMAVIVASRFR